MDLDFKHNLLENIDDLKTLCNILETDVNNIVIASAGTSTVVQIMKWRSL